MRAPRSISAGATIGVFAPSSPYPPERLAAGLAVLESCGFRPILSPELGQRQGYLAGDDASRVHLFHALLDDPAIEVLWAARGGYGLHRILDRLDPEKIRRADKPIVGFSDTCALHAVVQKAGLISFHGPVVTQLGDLGPREPRALLAALAGPPRWNELVYESDAERPLVPGNAVGRLLGGCLSVLAPLVGTPWFPNLKGAILVLEDVGEATYRIDRMLTHLRLAGCLEGLAGVAAGDFAGCKPQQPDQPDVEAVLAERLQDLGIPVLSGLPFGHGQRNLPLPLGARARLDANARRLSIEGP